MDRTDNWCMSVSAGSLWANFARLVRGRDATQVHDRWRGDVKHGRVWGPKLCIFVT
jgi:hypothetical protein